MTDPTNTLLEGGWGALNDIGAEPTKAETAQLNRALEEQYQEDLIYLRAFSTVEGQAMLEDLKKKYIMINSYDPGVVNPDQHGHFFEGHRNVVLQMMKRIERAKLGSPIQAEIEL